MPIYAFLDFYHLITVYQHINSMVYTAPESPDIYSDFKDMKQNVLATPPFNIFSGRLLDVLQHFSLTYPKVRK